MVASFEVVVVVGMMAFELVEVECFEQVRLALMVLGLLVNQVRTRA